MFAFFINGSFFGFWQNKINDVFCESTIEAMGWNSEDVILYHYQGLKSAPEFYEFGDADELIVKKKVTTQVEESFEENGETKTRLVDVDSFEIDKTISPVIFYENGEMIRPC